MTKALIAGKQDGNAWQLLISQNLSGMHIHGVVTCYNNCQFLCAWHVTIMVFFALPPCFVDESYSHVCVPKVQMYYWSVHVVAKYKNLYENNTQYPFYTIAVKHAWDRRTDDTDSLIGGNKSANNKMTLSVL